MSRGRGGSVEVDEWRMDVRFRRSHSVETLVVVTFFRCPIAIHNTNMFTVSRVLI
jgi:hypothetical protein